MVSKEYPRIGETVWHGQMENGLHIYVDEKRGFQKSYAFFATNYGGMDMRFELDGAWQDTPAGVAHFLEHKMFDTKDGNALQELAQNGASPNAFTSSAITGYYFESTEKFYENLKILLSFVSIPYFTQESVEKEQGIIGQEIRMIEDDPYHQIFYAMLEGLYARHPIRVSVAGTQESISHITADTLYQCHRAFYNPANMVLCVAGEVDPERVFALAKEILPQEGRGRIACDYGPPEGNEAAQAEKTLYMEVSTSIFQLGFKADPAPAGEARMRQELVSELACEILLGTSSPLYAQLYSSGLVNKSFSYGYEAYPGCAMFCAGGESRDPQAVRDAVLAEAERLGQEGVDETFFQRLKKAAYGSRVCGLNSFEHVCVGMAQAHFDGADLMRFPEMFDTITLKDVASCIQTCFVPSHAALAVVQPRGEAQ